MLRLRRRLRGSPPRYLEAMVTDKVASLKACGRERLVTADCGCLFNIAGRASTWTAPPGSRNLRCRRAHRHFLWRRRKE